jgi:hypothetical protein
MEKARTLSSRCWIESVALSAIRDCFLLSSIQCPLRFNFNLSSLFVSRYNAVVSRVCPGAMAGGGSRPKFSHLKQRNRPKESFL